MRGFVLAGITVLLVLVTSAVAADAPPGDLAVGLSVVNAHRLGVNLGAMIVLGGWAALNILVGVVYSFRTSGSVRAFFQMTALWNVVNLVIAVAGWQGSAGVDPADFTLAATVAEVRFIQNLLLLNVGLDVAYIAAGGWMSAHAKTRATAADRWRGFGRAVMLQGAFLLCFDSTLAVLQAANDAPLTLLLDAVAPPDDPKSGS
ncbi:MAG: DUF6992 family protein [Planctomycetia bacterium]